MSDELEQAPPAPPALGPGDDDPRSPAAVVPDDAAAAPLGPGDDDPRSPVRGQAAAAAQPLAPGELDGPDPLEGFVMLAQAAPGPGEMPVVRQITRIPIKE